VLSAEGKPLRNVRMLAYHLSSERSYASNPTNRKGEFALGGLPFGYFDLAVETERGLHLGNRTVNVAPDSKTAVVLRLSSAVAASAPRGRWPGDERVPAGEALVTERLRGRAFWRSPRGVAILAATGGLILLLFAGGRSRNPNDETGPGLP